MSNSKPKSIFDHCHETASQEVFLRRCGFALQEDPSDSEPSVEVSPMQVDRPNAETDSSESERVIAAIFEQESNEMIRLVSPQTSAEETADLVVNIVTETKRALDEALEVQEKDSIALKTPGNLSNRPISSSGNRKGKSVESPVKENRGKKPKIPFREIVRAIVMNSRNAKEEDETEPMSCVEAMESMGIKFPHYPHHPKK